MLKVLSFMFFALPTLSFAQRALPPIDFAGLFELYADDVIESELAGTQTLNLSGEVLIERRGTKGEYEYTGTDKSDDGAVGCMALIMIELKAFEMICPDLMSDSQKSSMESGLARVMAFYAENVYPPLPFEMVSAAVDQEIREMAEKRRLEDPKLCTERADILGFYNNLITDELGQVLASVLEVPRLPVINPCL